MGQLNVRIDDALHRAVRIRIIELGGHRGSLRVFVESALRQSLSTFSEPVDQKDLPDLVQMCANEGKVE